MTFLRPTLVAACLLGAAPAARAVPIDRMRRIGVRMGVAPASPL